MLEDHHPDSQPSIGSDDESRNPGQYLTAQECWARVDDWMELAYRLSLRGDRTSRRDRAFATAHAWLGAAARAEARERSFRAYMSARASEPRCRLKLRDRKLAELKAAA